MQFNRFRIRQDIKQKTPRRHGFLLEAQQYLEDPTQDHIKSTPFDAIENHLIALYRAWFPKVQTLTADIPIHPNMAGSQGHS